MDSIFKKSGFLLEPPQRKRVLIGDLAVALLLFVIASTVQSILITPMYLFSLITSFDFTAVINGTSSIAAELSNVKVAITNIPVWLVIIELFSFVVFIFAVLICRLCAERGNLKSLGISKKGWFSNYILGFCVGALVFSLCVLLSIITRGIRVSGPSISSFGEVIVLIVILLGFVVQGAAEEFLFRGFMMTAIARKHSVGLAIILNSLFFALAHIGNNGVTLLALINVMLFGIFASIIMLKTENIFIVCALHTAWNFFQGNFFGISVSGMTKMPSVFTSEILEANIFNGGVFGLEGSICVTIVLVIGILIFPILKSKDITKAKKDKLIKKA